MKLLLLAWRSSWFGAPRLATALGDAGFEVAALSTPGALLPLSRRISRRLDWTPGADASIDEFERALDAFRPDRLVPTCDASVAFLHRCHAEANLDAGLRALIARSLGDPGGYLAASDKWHTTLLARALGIEVPASARVEQPGDAYDFVGQHGFPVVLKGCRGSAGTQVYPCDGPRMLREALKQCDERQGRQIQRYHEGSTWSSTYVADRGSVRAMVVAEKIETHPYLVGPSTVLRFAHMPVIERGTVRLVESLGASGFGSVDWLCEPGGRALLLEHNPRATPLVPLGARVGPDLVAAYRACLQRDAAWRPAAQRSGVRIALYPQELLRAPGRTDFGDAWLDRPDDEPVLLAELASRHAEVAAYERHRAQAAADPR